MNDNKEIKALSDEELENIDGGKLSPGGLMVAVAGGTVLGLAAITGIALAVADASTKKNAKKLGLSVRDYLVYKDSRLGSVDEFKAWKESGVSLAEYYKSTGRDASWVNDYWDLRTRVNDFNKYRK